MCQAENRQCTGCRRIRPWIRRCESYDSAADSCVNMNLENPPLKPHYQLCDNLECPFVNPVLQGSNPGLDLDDFAGIMMLKQANDEMDATAALVATGATSETVQPQTGEQIAAVVDASGGIGDDSLGPIFGNGASRASTPGVYLPQMPETPGSPVEPMVGIDMPSEHEGVETATQVSNGSLLAFQPGSNERPDIQMQQTDAQTQAIAASQPQPEEQLYIDPKLLTKTASPFSFPDAPTVTNTAAVAQPLREPESSNITRPHLPNISTSDPSPGLSQANSQIPVAQMRVSSEPNMMQRKRRIPLNRGLSPLVAAATTPTVNPVQGSQLLPRTQTAQVTQTRPMRPVDQALMRRLMDPRSSHPQRRRTVFRMSRSQELAGTPAQDQQPSATGQPQDGLRNLGDGMASRTPHPESNTSFEAQALRLRAQHYVPVSQPSPAPLEAMNNEPSVEHYAYMAAYYSKPVVRPRSNWDRLFERRTRAPPREESASLNEAGPGFVQQAPPNSEPGPWSPLHSQLQPSSGHGIPQPQPALTSDATMIVSSNTAVPQIQSTALDNDRVFWDHFPQSTLQTNMLGQNSFQQNDLQQNGFQQNGFQKNRFQQNDF
ncbi:hypothetical protein CGRA01v4_07808 [Colletotrichum graminicola]|nr:hypothetical protein CGRA01v4_07808 [Colletotrichum graminicola]